MFRTHIIPFVALLACLCGRVESADLLFVSLGDNTVVTFDVSLASALDVQNSKNIYASGGLNGPEGLAFDSSGNLYVSNSLGNTIVKFTPQGVSSTFASGLNSPRGLAFDNSGNLYAANFVGNYISKFDSGGTSSVFANGLSGPYGLAFDTAGNLYAGNSGNGIITKFDSGGTPSTFATGQDFPEALTFGKDGYLYVLDFRTFDSKPDLNPPSI